MNLEAPDSWAVYMSHDDSEGSQNASLNFVNSTVNVTGATQSYGTISLTDSLYNLEGVSTFKTAKLAGSNATIVVNELPAAAAAAESDAAAQKVVVIGENAAEGVVVAAGGFLNDQFADPAAALQAAVQVDSGNAVTTAGLPGAISDGWQADADGTMTVTLNPALEGYENFNAMTLVQWRSVEPYFAACGRRPRPSGRSRRLGARLRLRRLLRQGCFGRSRRAGA